MMKSDTKKMRKYFRLEVLIPLLILLGVALHDLNSKTAFKLIINGTSMSPTYQDRETVWATILYSRIVKDDVVVIKLDNEHTIVKRVRFVPGDTFWAIKDDSLHWTPIPDDIVDDFKKLNIWKLRKITIPNGMLWLEGDNKESSYDSRIHGLFESQYIIGVVAPWRPNIGKITTTPIILRMQNFKKQGLPITRGKFIGNGFKL